MSDLSMMPLDIFKDIVEGSSKINTTQLQRVVGLSPFDASEKTEHNQENNQDVILQKEKEVSITTDSVEKENTYDNEVVTAKEKVDIISIQEIKRDSMSEDVVIKTRLDIVQNLVDDMFASFSLTSINTSFFGDLVLDLIPSGYLLQKIGIHTFFVKEEKDLNLPSIISFLDKIKKKLSSDKIVSVPIVFKRNIEGSVIRSLVLSERELLEIMKIYPDYQFGYSDHMKQIDDIKLVIRMGGKEDE